MVEFHWRTTGTRDFRGLEICRLPPAVILLFIIAFAVFVSVLLTGKVTEQEEQHAAIKPPAAELEAPASLPAPKLRTKTHSNSKVP
jgi:hypothetical protein